MANIRDDPAGLNDLQDDRYRDKVLRARKMTAEQRLAEALELTNSVSAGMHEGAMWQLGTTDPQVGWQQVRRRLARWSRVQDQGRFVTEGPSKP